jgi:hypothetical protein
VTLRPAVLLLALTSTSTAVARQSEPPPPIMDNSFLLEEAYNQEAGVVQHISLFVRERGGSWAYAFTQEWPFRGQRHQLSFTVPVVHSAADPASSTGVGDLALNYRLQALGGEGRRFWLAPRASIVVPSGSWRRGHGDGNVGVQVALPASIELSPRLTAHVNAAAQLIPRARNSAGSRATIGSMLGGASLIAAVLPTLNLMVEGLVEHASEVTGPSETQSGTSGYINPGFRWAHNFKSGLQIVPGASYAIGLGDAKDADGLVLYLSFEHPFKR